MSERRQLEFFLLRYVPHALRQEFVNIGVLMVEAGENGSVLADIRFAKDCLWVGPGERPELAGAI